MMTQVIDFTPLHKSNEQLLMDKTFIVKIQEHGGEDETPPVSQRPSRPYQAVMKKSYMLTTLPFPQVGPAPHREVVPEPMVPPEGKGSKCEHPAPPMSWESYSGFATGGSQGNLWSSTTGNQIGWRKEEGSQKPELGFWQAKFLLAAPKWQPQSGNLLICRAKMLVQSDQGTRQGTSLPNLEPQTKGLVSPRAWSGPPPRQESQLTTLTTASQQT